MPSNDSEIVLEDKLFKNMKYKIGDFIEIDSKDLNNKKNSNKKNNNWQKSAMQYHSKNIRRGTNYKNKLVKHYAQYVRTDIQSALF